MHLTIARLARQSSFFAFGAIAAWIMKSPSTSGSETNAIRICDDILLHRRRVANSIFAQKIAQGARVREETHPAPCPPAMKMHSHLRYLEDPITDLSFTEKSKGKEGSLVV